LVDGRGPRFPEEYREILALEIEYVDIANQLERINTESISGLFDRHRPETGDVVFLGEGDNLMAYVCASFGWEVVKFGAAWKSPT
jgi:hypothetical protein